MLQTVAAANEYSYTVVHVRKFEYPKCPLAVFNGTHTGGDWTSLQQLKEGIISQMKMIRTVRYICPLSTICKDRAMVNAYMIAVS